jgi:hypothetical protein
MQDSKILTDGSECRSTNIFVAKGVQPVGHLDSFFRGEGNLVKFPLIVLDGGVKTHRKVTEMSSALRATRNGMKQ